MKEATSISKLYMDLYHGNPWIDINIMSVIKNITASQAATQAIPGCNSIWEIVNHMILWRMNVLRRVQGELIKSPANNYFSPVKNSSHRAWLNTLKKLEISQQHWMQFLKTFKEKDFEKVYPGNQMNYYEHIHGIIQHDAYHLGQIVLLKKILP